MTGQKHQPLGDLGVAHLQVDPEIKPCALPCRNLPVALKADVQAELNTLVDRGVLIPVTELTQWVSQMAVVQKANGKLRICIDPQPLNEALMREYYNLPTLDDVLPMLHDAKMFSKLDVKEAFWHEESSKLTTMITPFGRFRWARWLFGLRVSRKLSNVNVWKHQVILIEFSPLLMTSLLMDVVAQTLKPRRTTRNWLNCKRDVKKTYHPQ